MSEPNKADFYLTQLLGQAKVVLTGASDAEMRVQFFDVLREFFDNSNSWLENIGITVIPHLLDYQLQPLSGRIIRLNGVYDQNNVPQNAVMPVPGLLHFLYPYNDVLPMSAIVIKNVDGPLECFPPDFPEWLLPQYGVGLLDGILGRMMAQPGQSWADRATATYHLQRFRDCYCKARVATRLANTVGAQAWAYPQQFRASTQRGGVSTFNVNPSPMPPR